MPQEFFRRSMIIRECVRNRFRNSRESDSGRRLKAARQSCLDGIGSAGRSSASPEEQKDGQNAPFTSLPQSAGVTAGLCLPSFLEPVQIFSRQTPSAVLLLSTAAGTTDLLKRIRKDLLPEGERFLQEPQP